MTEPSPVATLKFESAFQELETIVDQLEEAECSLEEMLALFERGQELARHCETLLDQADLRVQQIVGGEIQDFDQEL
jgi:exodeoxyribonuclease VII small subunit